MNTALIFFTISATCSLLLLLYLIPNLLSNSNKKIKVSEKEYVPVSVKPLIGIASDWKIINFYREETFVIGELVELNVDWTAALILQERLKTCTNSDDCFIRGNSMGNTAILIRNKDNKELYIGWHNDEIRVGDRLHESSYGRIVPITDYIS